MPCMDYDTRWGNDWESTRNDSKQKEMKQHADKLARIACKAMDALEELEQEDFLLLKDDEVREWWRAHKEADRKQREEEAALAERKRVKEELRQQALGRLTEEEKIALGLVKKAKGK